MAVTKQIKNEDQIYGAHLCLAKSKHEFITGTCECKERKFFFTYLSFASSLPSPMIGIVGPDKMANL